MIAILTVLAVMALTVSSVAAIYGVCVFANSVPEPEGNVTTVDGRDDEVA